jgi:hypothetical protein
MVDRDHSLVLFTLSQLLSMTKLNWFVVHLVQPKKAVASSLSLYCVVIVIMKIYLSVKLYFLKVNGGVHRNSYPLTIYIFLLPNVELRITFMCCRKLNLAAAMALKSRLAQHDVLFALTHTYNGICCSSKLNTSLIIVYIPF